MMKTLVTYSDFKFFEQNDFKNTIVISGFPGIGKSHFFTKMENSGVKVLDSDSSLFSWIEEGVRNPDFPNNYMEHIKENLGEVDIILVSSHRVVRDALVENDIPFVLVYPAWEIKEEYLDRYRRRGSNEKFVELLDKNWDNFIEECEEQEGCRKITIETGEYLSDKIEEILDDNKFQII